MEAEPVVQRPPPGTEILPLRLEFAQIFFVHLQLANVRPAADVGLAEGDQVGAEQREGEGVVLVGL